MAKSSFSYSGSGFKDWSGDNGEGKDKDFYREHGITRTSFADRVREDRRRTAECKTLKSETVFEIIAFLYEVRGGENYMIGEAITQSEHVLQAAALAEQAGAPESMVIAALFHDIGHVAYILDPHAAEKGVDTKHEALGARYLMEQGFPESVVYLVQQHVNAKRYLVSTDSAYESQLPPASVTSLKLQGKKMSPEDVEAFEASPVFKDTVPLHFIDEMSKVAGLKVPGFRHYKAMMCRVLLQQPEAFVAKDDNYRENLRESYQLMVSDPAQWESQLRERSASFVSRSMTKKPAVLGV